MRFLLLIILLTFSLLSFGQIQRCSTDEYRELLKEKFMCVWIEMSYQKKSYLQGGKKILFVVQSSKCHSHLDQKEHSILLSRERVFHSYTHTHKSLQKICKLFLLSLSKNMQLLIQLDIFAFLCEINIIVKIYLKNLLHIF